MPEFDESSVGLGVAATRDSRFPKRYDFAAQVMKGNIVIRCATLLFAGLIAAQLSVTHLLAQDSTGVSGIDQSLFSESVSPGQSFYQYANEKWLESTKIPADKSNYGIFTILDDATRAQVRSLIESAAEQPSEHGSAAQKVGDLYRSVLNQQARNDAGIKPIQPLLDRIDAIDSKQDLVLALGELSRSGVYGPLGAYINNDAKKSDSYTVYVTQAGLTMPDRDYYLEDDERYITLRKQLKEYIADMLSYVGVEDPNSAAEAVFDIESRIAENHWTKTENRDPIKTYNKKSSAEMKALLGEFDWDAYVTESGLGEQSEFVVRQPSFFEALGKQLSETELEDWKNYLRMQLIDAYASSLSESIERRHFDFHSTAISGVTEQEPIWKRGVNVSSGILG